MFVSRLCFFRLVNFILGKGFPLPYAHWKVIVAPGESISLLLDCEEYFFLHSQADITDTCAHFSGPSETLAPDTGAFLCCKYISLYLLHEKNCCIQCLFSPREHLA